MSFDHYDVSCAQDLKINTIYIVIFVIVVIRHESNIIRVIVQNRLMVMVWTVIIHIHYQSVDIQLEDV